MSSIIIPRSRRMRVHRHIPSAGIWPIAWTLMLAILTPCAGQDWTGSFTISPESAPQMALDAGAGGSPGAAVTLAASAAATSRPWRITPMGGGFYKIQPAASLTMVLAASGGGSANGTAIVLEADSGQPWQVWSIAKAGRSTWCLNPKHAPTKGLDDFAGGKEAGSKQDLWDCVTTDEHLQWRLTPLAGATVPPEAAGVADIPAGTIKEFTFDGSAIFPGTKRSGAIFIPAQYDGSAPACVYVRQDGYNGKEKAMLEELIAAKSMPVTIGVFIRPGDLPAPMKDTLGRRNRCFEYDGVGDNYVRFLVDELLPYVAKTFNVKLSTSGNDRCIAGGSSGGIAAFNAAWERPDAFSRVYANSGSFVAFRAGNEFPTLIRKVEAKPIRAFLTTGTGDMENCAGDWFLLDQEMDKALKFSGYDYIFRIVNGGHVAGWAENFPEAMTFIWKGWPEPVKAGLSAPRVRDILSPGAGWEPVAANCTDARAAACNAKGEVFFIDIGANRISRIGTDGVVSTVVADAGQADGLAITAQGDLITVSSRTSKVMGYDASGAGHVIAEGIPARSVLARPDGTCYLTGSPAGEGSDGGTIWLLKGDTHAVVEHAGAWATGLAYRPDQWLLAVADGHSKWISSLEIKADGTLANKERFFCLSVADGDDDAGAEGMCYSREGQLFVATRSGIQVCADDGPTQVILPMPNRSRVLGVCFGGSDLNTLYAFCGGSIWKRLVKPHALGAFTPWTKVHGTPL
jgi:enterochelin esterase-like enzyme/sugar lactone lactonase YvrE